VSPWTRTAAGGRSAKRVPRRSTIRPTWTCRRCPQIPSSICGAGRRAALRKTPESSASVCWPVCRKRALFPSIRTIGASLTISGRVPTTTAMCRRLAGSGTGALSAGKHLVSVKGPQPRGQIAPRSTALAIQGMTTSSICSSVVVASKPRTRLAFSTDGTRRWTS
jgi:hypothetical protein